MNVESKHREVSRQLLSEIAAGKYGASGRLPGEEQLVKKFGVSRTTVGRALRDLQTEGVIERRAGSGTYVRNGDIAMAIFVGYAIGQWIPRIL